MALEKILLDGSEDGESAGIKINTSFDAIDQNTLALNGTQVITEDTTKTVGIGKDFETLHLALRWAQKLFFTGNDSILTLSLDDGVHPLGGEGEFDWDSYSYYSFYNSRLNIISSSGNRANCLVTMSSYDDGDTYGEIIHLSNSIISSRNITYDMAIGGYPYPTHLYTFSGYFSTHFILWDCDCRHQYTAFWFAWGTILRLRGTITIDDSDAEAILVTDSSALYVAVGTTISNADKGIGVHGSSTVNDANNITFINNTQDTNIPLNEIQFDGSYISDGLEPLSINGALLPTGVRTPKGAMNLVLPNSQILNDATYTPLEYDQIVIDRGGVTPSLLDGSITIPTTDTYEFDLSVDADFQQQEQLDIMVFVNGTAVSTEPLALQGQGNGKPNAITWNTTYNFNAGDVVYLGIKNGDSGNLTVNFRRLYFALKLDI